MDLLHDLRDIKGLLAKDELEFAVMPAEELERLLTALTTIRKNGYGYELLSCEWAANANHVDELIQRLTRYCGHRLGIEQKDPRRTQQICDVCGQVRSIVGWDEVMKWNGKLSKEQRPVWSKWSHPYRCSLTVQGFFKIKPLGGI